MTSVAGNVCMAVVLTVRVWVTVKLTQASPFLHSVPAAFAGLMYLFVRQKYFVGYLGERTQR